MFTVYYSNQLTALAEMLIHHQKVNSNEDPFQPETILVQSVGMAQWLQMRIAESLGVAGNYEFPFPTSFLWQQYRLLFPHLPKENIFERGVMTWRLMRIIPSVLERLEFQGLRAYLTHDKEQDSLKLYQLATKIADLFDQYLVYRPHWLVHWENGQWQEVVREIQSQPFSTNLQTGIQENVHWQSLLWNMLIEDTRKDYDELLFTTSHRAYLQQKFFDKLEDLTEEEYKKLPKRIFVFGISSLPTTQFATLLKLSEYCDVHLFFLNPSQMYWGDSIENVALEKMALKQQLSETEIQQLLAQQGNQLLSMWGKQGRDFFDQLAEYSPEPIELFFENEQESNLSRLKQAILNNDNPSYLELENDNSIQIHNCHSAMREVEVLQNQLLHLFEQNPHLSPKDIIVMAADIEQYAPYINAVFSRYGREDARYIPFTISDQKISQVDPVISSFLVMLKLRESTFSAEALLDLLEVEAIGQQFGFNREDLTCLRHWIKESGIRSTLTIEQENGWQNYNSWENGLDRLLLGSCLKEENGIWQNTIAFNESYGLSAERVGKLAEFIEKLTAWSVLSLESHPISTWKQALENLVKAVYQENDASNDALFLIQQELEALEALVLQAKFDEAVAFEVIERALQDRLNSQSHVMHFMTGKVNFCTLLPMRAIPFKVVCLLGMNEADFPRQPMINSFDLMQYHPRKGDRARREDDRYLFLEALLSAEEVFYISYVGKSLVKDEKREPSVLVSQFVDYLAKYYSLSLEQEHPMNAFSERNFKSGYVSYHKEWLEFTQQAVESHDFFAKSLPENNELPKEIELDELIAFIQSPTKQFFTRNLGIYFREEDDEIEDTEHFALSKLDEYQLSAQLLTTSNEMTTSFFEKETLKGNIPVLNFGKLTQTELTSRIQDMRVELAEYLKGESDILPFSLQCTQVEVVGNLPNLFGQEIVLWRVGKLRDKDTIKLWIYFLILTLLEKPFALKMYTLEGDKLACFTFNTIEVSQAKEILEIYIKAFLKNKSTLTIAVTQDLENYFKKMPQENIAEYCYQSLSKLSEGLNDEASYLKRILTQSSLIDYQAIHQNTLDWFALMQESKRRKEE